MFHFKIALSLGSSRPHSATKNKKRRGEKERKIRVKKSRRKLIFESYHTSIISML